MKIAILSDTHNLLRAEVKEIISGCDAVIHAGDVASLQTLEELRLSVGSEISFYVVRGNNDRDWAKVLPQSLLFTLGGVKFFLVHNRKDVPKDLGDVQVVVYGHSHKYTQEMVDGRLWLNPGSCGKRRFRSAVTMAVLYLEKKMHNNQNDICKEPSASESKREDSCGQFGEVAWWIEKVELDVAETDRVQKDALAKRVDFSEGKLVGIVTEIFERMDKGQTISYIAKKVGMEEELVEQICRIRVTHPGVTPGGVVDKMEVNRETVRYK